MEQKKNTLFQEFISLISVVLLACLIRTLVFEPFYIPSSSMEPTLLEGDYVFSTKYDYGYSKYSLSPLTFDIFQGRILQKQAKRGDIMIFRPPHQMKDRYIKRLIGLPGDKIQIRQGELFINEKLVEKKYIDQYVDRQGHVFKRYKEILPGGVTHDIIHLQDNDSTEVFNVPAGHYFFLGDNRDLSKDSRYELGFVPDENVISKAKIIHFSTEYPMWVSNQSFAERIKQVWLWASSIRWGRMFHSLYE